MEDLIRESLGLKDHFEEKEAVPNCEELQQLIEDDRMLLGHIQDVTSESAKRTYIALNKKLLLLWQEFFRRCPKIAKKRLREATKFNASASTIGHKKNANLKFCWNCCFLNGKDVAFCDKCGKALV